MRKDSYISNRESTDEYFCTLIRLRGNGENFIMLTVLRKVEDHQYDLLRSFLAKKRMNPISIFLSRSRHDILLLTHIPTLKLSSVSRKIIWQHTQII